MIIDFTFFQIPVNVDILIFSSESQMSLTVSGMVNPFQKVFHLFCQIYQRSRYLWELLPYKMYLLNNK